MTDGSSKVHWLAALDNINARENDSSQFPPFGMPLAKPQRSPEDEFNPFNVPGEPPLSHGFLRIDRHESSVVLSEILKSLKETGTDDSFPGPFKLTSLEAFLIRHFVDEVAPTMNLFSQDSFVSNFFFLPVNLLRLTPKFDSIH